ncbi:MAG: hypothetical protein CMN72_16220 [Sphingomonas sp.]|nr:hypothetical protein [Sphingomonas sp.]|tara:strand:- start:247 stop:1005 length:759 start_codon:yes stop_codon:yes gene_type:complete
MRRLGEGFWNLRGDFRIAGLINIGTQMSLVRRPGGRFLLIDSCELREEDRQPLHALTDGGEAIEAVINVHPFHTLHCRSIRAVAPHARLIGTQRHHDKLPDLPWDPLRTEDAALQAEFADTLEFSIPDGVDFISDDESVHVSSVVVRHLESGVVHVDDTLNSFEAPGLLKPLVSGRLRFHPMLSKALKPEPGAADAYAEWARDLAGRWSGTPAVCTAHSAIRDLDEGGWRSEILNALSRVEKTLHKHRASHG